LKETWASEDIDNGDKAFCGCDLWRQTKVRKRFSGGVKFDHWSGLVECRHAWWLFVQSEGKAAAVMKRLIKDPSCI